MGCANTKPSNGVGSRANSTVGEELNINDEAKERDKFPEENDDPLPEEEVGDCSLGIAVRY